jgi:hypothetical protein
MAASGRIVAATMATLNNSETREPTTRKIQASSPSKQNTNLHFAFLVLTLLSVFFSFTPAAISGEFIPSIAIAVPESKKQNKHNKPWKHYSTSPSTISRPTTRERFARDCARSMVCSQRSASPLPRRNPLLRSAALLLIRERNHHH